MNDMSNLEPIVHHLRKFERVKSSYNDMEVSLLPGHRHMQVWKNSSLLCIQVLYPYNLHRRYAIVRGSDVAPVIVDDNLTVAAIQPTSARISKVKSGQCQLVHVPKARKRGIVTCMGEPQPLAYERL